MKTYNCWGLNLPARITRNCSLIGEMRNLSDKEVVEKFREMTDSEFLKHRRLGRSTLRALDDALEEVGKPRYGVKRGYGGPPSESVMKSQLRRMVIHYGLKRVTEMAKEADAFVKTL